jgi:putative ABC transport system ATP-binding protein
VSEPSPAAAPDPITGRLLVRQIIRRRRRPMIAAAGCWSVHQTCETLVPVAIGVIIDRAITPGDGRAMLLSVIGLFVLFGVLTFGYRIGMRVIREAELVEAHDLRAAAVSRLLAPGGVVTDRRTGDLLSMTTTDADLAAQILRVVPRVVSAGIALLVSTITLLWIDPLLGVVIMIGVPLVALGLNALAPRISHRTTAQQHAIGATAALAADLMTGLRALRGFGGEGVAADRYRRSSRQALTASVQAARADGSFQGVSVLAGGLLLAAVAAVAGAFALHGRISIGELITIVGLGQFVSEPVNGLAFGVRTRARCLAGAERVAELLAAPRRLADGTDPVRPGPLLATGVAAELITDVSLVAAPGEIVGVVVDEPAAAEELAELLSGVRRPVSGIVTVGGTGLADADHDSRTRALLAEPHRVDLFGDTLREALVEGRASDVPDDVVHAAMTAASADQLITEQGGLDRELGDRGFNLSGGQRQRAAFARALLADRPVLVLVDPTTAVDSVTEQRMAAGLRAERARGGRVTVVITSSPPLLAVCDRVVLIMNGVSVRSADHDQLLADPEYGKSYRAVVLR